MVNVIFQQKAYSCKSELEESQKDQNLERQTQTKETNNKAAFHDTYNKMLLLLTSLLLSLMLCGSRDVKSLKEKCANTTMQVSTTTTTKIMV